MIKLPSFSFSFLSPIPLYEAYLRRCFTASGLTYQAIEVDPETTVHFWGPRPVDRSKASLVLIHGFGPISIWQWRKQVQFFAPRFNVFVPDLIFFGESTTSSADRSERFQATSIGKLLINNLELEKFHVVGTSYGGFVAYRMAEMWPERVEKVVIASSGVNMTLRHNQRLLERAGRRKIEEVLLPSTAEQLRTLMGLAVFRRVRMVPDFILNDFIHKLYSDKRDEKMELLKGLTLGRGDRPEISSLNQDVLLIWGEHDNIFGLEMATELKRLLGDNNVKLEVMKKTSHVPQIEDPAQFNNIVNSFLNR